MDDAHAPPSALPGPVRSSHSVLPWLRDDEQPPSTRAPAPAPDVAGDLPVDPVEVLSHELRSPLTAIHLGTTVLRRRRRGADAPVREAVVDALDHEAQRLYRLVEDLLAVTRHHGGRVALPVQPLLLQRSLPAIVARASAGYPGVTFTTELHPDLPPVAADEEALAHVMRNVLGNAASFAGRQGPVEVVARAADECVELSVLDRGPGIEPDEADRIFEPFFHSRRAGGQGAGLGLSAARGLLRAMGGRIGVRERDGGGIAICIGLPIARS